MLAAIGKGISSAGRNLWSAAKTYAKRGAERGLESAGQGISHLLSGSSRSPQTSEQDSALEQTGQQLRSEFSVLVGLLMNPATAIPLLITLVLLVVAALAYNLVLPAAPILEGAGKFL